MSIVSKKIMMGSGAVALPSDDQFNRVSFLSHFDGENNGVNSQFTDGSASNHTITANGNVTQGSFGPFARPDGEWGCEFSANGDTLNLGSSTDFNFAGDFSIEMFLMDSATDGIVFANHKQGVNTGYYFFNRPARLALHNEGDGFNLGNDNIQPVGVWYHLVISRQSGSMRVFIDGVLKAVVSNSSAITSSIHDFMIGGTTNSSGNLDFTCNAKVSNFRIVNGSCATAYQTSSTTIGATIFTVPTGALTAETNTKLLTCQSNRFVDNSGSAHTATPTGNTAVTAFGPFLTSSVYSAGTNGASGYFDGSGDYLTTPYASSIANWYSTDYTIEAWVYYTAFTQSSTPNGNPNVLKHGQTGSANDYWSFGAIANGTLKFYYFNGSAIDTCVSTATLSLNTWHHIAMCHDDSDNEINLYLDGVSVKTHTVAGTPQSSSSSPFIMIIGEADSVYFTGYMSDLRVTNGTEVYTSAFTPPTAPLTAITNTKLLLNMADGQAIDSAAQNNLTLFGTAKLSTGQAKFGDTSILFDGNSDFLTFPHSESNDISGAGNWTVEFFWRFVDNNATQYQEIATKGIGFQIYGNNGALSFALSANNTTTYFLSAANGTTLSDNTWYHIAAVKNGTAYNVYLNGTNEANLDVTSSSNVDTGTDPWCLGAYTSNSYYANGYMDEFRISKFARYTSNFTAPAEPFADKGQ